MSIPLSMSLNCPPSGYTISWASDINNAFGGYVSIFKNSSNVVYVGSTTSGSFTANAGDSIQVYVHGDTYTGLTVFSFIYVDTLQEASNSGSPSVTSSYSFTVSGAHYISGVTYDAV